MFTEIYKIFAINLIVQLKVPLIKLLKDYNEMIQWAVKEKKIFCVVEKSKVSIIYL